MTDATVPAQIEAGFFNALSATLMGSSSELIPASDARNVALALVGVSAVGAGYYTRKRAEAGKDAFAKILF